MNQPIVLITGALTGIGRATALAFAREGASVVVSGRRDDAGHTLAAELRALGVRAEYLRADVRNEAEVRSLVEQTVERFGRIDVAINNAGTEGQLGPITEQSEDNYRATFDSNVLGVLLAMKHEMRAMLRQGAGAIVNLSSIAGQVGITGASVYVASKHAVEGLTRSAALEGAAAGVASMPWPRAPCRPTCRAFHRRQRRRQTRLPGQPAARRAGTPEEIAQTIFFLASDKARFLTGQFVAVDGGYTAQ